MGLGDIGRELARVGKAFDMRVVGLVSSKERYHHMLNAGAVDELFETHATTPGNHGRRVRLIIIAVITTITTIVTVSHELVCPAGHRRLSVAVRLRGERAAVDAADQGPARPP
jgi:hypothetical protein